MGVRRKQPRKKRSRKSRRTRKRHRGSGFDIQKTIEKTGIEWHAPGYQFLGPGTKLDKRLKRGDKGKNRLDRIARQHDIDYKHSKNLQDKHRADRKMVQAIEKLPGRKSLLEHASKKMIQAKLALKL